MGILKRANVKLADYQKQEKTEQKIIKLVRQFFFYQYDNPYDVIFENQYLDNKHTKAVQYHAKSKATQSRYEGMKFTVQNIKRHQNIINFKARDFDYYDDFLPLFFSGSFHSISQKERLIYEKIDQDKKKENPLSFINNKLKKGLKFVLFSRMEQKGFYIDIASIFKRLEYITESIEMNNVLGIPPDFFVQNSLYHFHLWLIWNRLSEFKDHSRAQAFCGNIDALIQNYIFKKCHTITTTSKQNTLYQEMYQILENNRLLYMHHFLHNEQTMNDHLYKADAMVYLCIYQHKLDRYDDRIYKMAYYCVEAYRYFKTLDADQILDQEFDFNVFKVPIDYKEQLLIKNPQLTQEELQEEFSRAPEETRKIDYVYQEPKVRNQRDNSQNKNFELQNLIQRASYLANKFKSLSNYDMYEEREELEKQRQQKRERYAWKIQLSKQSGDFQKEFNPENTRIQKLKISDRLKKN